MGLLDDAGGVAEVQIGEDADVAEVGCGGGRCHALTHSGKKESANPVCRVGALG